MGQNWPYRNEDVNDMGGNGGRPDKGTGSSPRGRGYHPGRSCSFEAAKVAAVVALAARVAVLASRFVRRSR